MLRLDPDLGTALWSSLVARGLKINKYCMKICEKCSFPHEGSYGSGRFCSMFCVRSFATASNREETNKKISLGLAKPLRIFSDRICSECNKTFAPTSFKQRNQILCSRDCADAFRRKTAGRKGGLKSAEVQAATRRSKNEILFASLCSKEFLTLENVRMFEGWDADIILPELKIAIMWNGPWHRRKITRKHSVLQVQTRDDLKKAAIKRCGFEVYVINDDGKFDPEFVNQQFDLFKLRYSGMASHVGS